MGVIHLPYDPRPVFLPFHNRQSRFSVLVCHRRLGKTVAAVNDLIIGGLECPLANPQFAYIAPNYAQAKKVAWEYLKMFAGPVMESAHESELRVTLKNGARIFLLGAEKADSLRGMYLDGAVMDEFAQIRPSAVSQVIMPCLSDRQGWLVYMGTPKGKNHFYDVFRKARDDPAWFCLLKKASETGVIPQEELDLQKSMMDASDYEQEYECSFEASLKGAIYGADMELAEAEGRIRDIEVDPNLPVDCITDLGYTDDTVLGFFQQHRDGIAFIEVLSNSEVEWDYYLDEMDTRNVRDVYLPHDARAKNLQTGRSVVEQTIRRGYRPRIVPDHKLRDGIAATHKLLPYVHWNRSLCSEAVEAMKSYRRAWDEKLGCYKDHPVHDWSSHIADMVRYLGVVFANLQPSRSRIILPGQEPPQSHGASYAFNLEDLFTHWRTNPGLTREQ